MKLYVKTWCPWCIEAIDWLQNRGYQFDLVDVMADRHAYDHMISISRQHLTPTLETREGKVLADFDVRQLEKFLKVHNINS